MDSSPLSYQNRCKKNIPSQLLST